MMSVRKGDGLLDPRTKMMLLVTLPTFLLGGAGGEYFRWISLFLSLLPFLFLLRAGNYFSGFAGLSVFASVYASGFMISPENSGAAYCLYLLIYEVCCLLMPCGILAAFVVRTTHVGELIAGMERMKIPGCITIPCTVMFRFFPTLLEEYSSIGRAVRMRGISIGSVGPVRYVEYRMIPVLMSSVKIGNELTAAALTKGLGSHRKRTSIYRLEFHAADIILLTMCSAVFVLLFLHLSGISFWHS
ncbi:MAG: energy-coupling factor transporter transmembrane protein EcfT [Ruminobacter sp.]|uniref:energy-coupling factor transporter transmembrane component T n=1 Tax=Ruminobacter sp. TaxID=2774296 RepID=UPI00257E8BA3|nr:energy-coupling factor transporter transmembrane component T [Ruminobacter sp.]MBQ3775655.1 energy-coupling factor transporter transmembrane protein EcfT [Ruminobacter sp.]